MVLRTATAQDAAAGRVLMTEAYRHYRGYGAPGHAVPQEPSGDLGARLTAEGAWGVVAEHEGRVVGFGAFEPATVRPSEGPRVPGLAHVFAVFVTEAHWGDGTATALLHALHDEIRARGYEEARLFTPEPQARARRFYAREGWREVGEPELIEQLGMEMVELRRAC